MLPRTRLAVLGAGLIGKRHIQHILDEPAAELLAVVDPTSVGQDIAAKSGVAWYPSFAEMMKVSRPDGVIISTPNQMHVQNGLEAVEAGMPALIEKPVADNLAGGEKLIAAAEAAVVPLLAGHHRRHNPMIQKAKELIDSGRLGRILIANAMFWLMKPDDYFDVQWCRAAGAGPVFLNLIHDVDNLRYLFGDAAAVQARESHLVRGYEPGETAVIILEFENGVLATCSVSDSVVAPWSWEHTTGKTPRDRSGRAGNAPRDIRGEAIGWERPAHSAVKPSPPRRWRPGAEKGSCSRHARSGDQAAHNTSSQRRERCIAA